MSGFDEMPKAAWAVLEDDRLSVWDSRLPVFWRRDVARQYNRDMLRGTGKVVRVIVSRPAREAK